MPEGCHGRDPARGPQGDFHIKVLGELAGSRSQLAEALGNSIVPVGKSIVPGSSHKERFPSWRTTLPLLGAALGKSLGALSSLAATRFALPSSIFSQLPRGLAEQGTSPDHPRGYRRKPATGRSNAWYRESVQDRVVVVGGGAREHAFARALSATGARVVVAPGNAGTAACGANVAVPVTDVKGLVDLARGAGGDGPASLVFVGAELPLALGLVDALGAAGIPAFGPSRAAAQLESSKAFMKRFLARHGIPTAPFEVFEDAASACEFVERAGRPLVVKADGLAAGKGVVVARTTAEALEAVDRMMVQRVFGDAGRTVVIEEVLPGEEVSFHVISDGERFAALPAAQDHKRVRDRDEGPNTGGMGAYAPAPVVGVALRDAILARVIEPTLAGLAREGTPFRGALFAGIMVVNGEPIVLEFNVRFGDPEATALVPLYAASWLDLLRGAAEGRLPPEASRAGSVSTQAALSVVLAAEGYPEAPVTGDVIVGLDLPELAGTTLLHAGTARRPDGAVVTAGGRVLTVTGVGDTLATARERAYAAVGRISFRGAHHRSDIGARALRGDGALTPLHTG